MIVKFNVQTAGTARAAPYKGFRVWTFLFIVDFNDIIKADRDGTLADYSLPELKEMRRICTLHLQKQDDFMIHPCASVESEIRRKEDAEVEQRIASRDREKIETIRNLDARIATIDGRLSTLERVASRPEFRTWGFRFSIVAIIIALVALFRDYLGWSYSVPTPPAVSQSAVPSPSNSIQSPNSSLSKPAPKSLPAILVATNLLDSSTSQPLRKTPKL